MTDLYLIDAVSHADAEERAVEECRAFVNDKFEVTGVRRAKYAELFRAENTDCDYWNKCKIGLVTLDERTSVEKKSFTNILVQASDLRDVINRLDEGMKSTMADYVISSVVETAIVDVFFNN